MSGEPSGRLADLLLSAGTRYLGRGCRRVVSESADWGLSGEPSDRSAALLLTAGHGLSARHSVGSAIGQSSAELSGAQGFS
jgi:hypothetical protein